MKPVLPLLRLPVLVVSLLAFPCSAPLRAQDAAPSAKALASQLSSAIRDGSSTVRLKMEISGTGTVLQLQVKSRRTPAGTDLLYQVLWPKERKGEGFVIRTSASGAATGTLFTPPDTFRPLTSADLTSPVFGSELTYADLVENFFAWEQQTVTGEETVDRVPCVILESRPGGANNSGYSLVRSWIDPKRMVPLRMEKFNRSGSMVSRLTTTRVAKDDSRNHVPASFTVQRAGQSGVTTLEGSNSRHDVTLKDSDFTPEALRTITR